MRSTLSWLLHPFPYLLRFGAVRRKVDNHYVPCFYVVPSHFIRYLSRVFSTILSALSELERVPKASETKSDRHFLRLDLAEPGLTNFSLGIKRHSTSEARRLVVNIKIFILSLVLPFHPRIVTNMVSTLQLSDA